MRGNRPHSERSCSLLSMRGYAEEAARESPAIQQYLLPRAAMVLCLDTYTPRHWLYRYPVADSDSFLPVATTRPETILGDTAVAVNPEDSRYKHFVGRECVVPGTGRRIPIIADSYVDMEFGTGALKITPAHDPKDYEVSCNG